MANKINEDLKRFNSLLGYNPQKGNQLSEAKVRRTAPGYLTEEEPEGEEPEEGGEEEFDFGGETEGEGEEPEEGGDFDFGDEGSPEDEGEAETEEDEFGTADEFSAVYDLETTEEDEVEEIDVTSIVNKSDEAREMAQQAVTVGQ